jgi:hypothetical protein
MLRANALRRDPGRQGLGAVIDRAEAMRYLAEMPWAPDAVLGNPEVTWADLGEGRSRPRLTRLRAGWPSVHARRGGRYRGDEALRPDAGPDGAESCGSGAGATGATTGSAGGASRSRPRWAMSMTASTGAIGAGGSPRWRFFDRPHTLRFPADPPQDDAAGPFPWARRLPSIGPWPTRDSSISVCTPSIRCWKARCG